MNLYKSTFLIFLAAMMASCNKGPEVSCKLSDVEFVFEGPLFEGPNSGNVTIANDLKTCTGSDITPEQVRSARLVTAKIKAVEGANLNQFSDFKLSLMGGDDLPMTSIAQKNPVSENSNQTDLEISGEAEADEFFKSKEYILLLDGGLKGDVEENIVLKADLEFVLTTK